MLGCWVSSAPPPLLRRLLTPLLMLLLLRPAGAAPDYRFLSYAELQPSLGRFSAQNVTRYSEILFDVLKYQLIVGARDHLYRLSARSLQVLEIVHWPPPASDVTMCENKGMSAGDCHNYVRVLHRRGERLLACGTSAFRPQCSWRSVDALGQILSTASGTAVCPYSPHLNVTSLVTSEGEVFAGTPADFSGLDAAVYGGKAKLRTRKYDSRLLSGPQFVGAFETADHVYTVYREDAVEYMSCGKRVFSRISRVCKNDQGNRRKVWTTFLKARLNCSVSGEYPFYLDHVQSVQYMPEEQLLYATFTTPDSALPGSAICVFPLASIQAAFSGPFRQQSATGGVWRRHEDVPHDHFECQSPGLTTGHALAELAKYSLMDEAVQQRGTDPLHVQEGVRLTSLAVDVVSTHHPATVHVLFATDTRGRLQKLSVPPGGGRACLLEVLQPFPQDTVVLTARLLSAAGTLYLGTDSGLVSVPVQRCMRYGDEEACLAAQDPYCGWDGGKQQCSPAPSGNNSAWRQLEPQCPDLAAPVAGGWSAWGEWKPCKQDGSEEEGCICRTRSCSRPPPANGGAPCSGREVEVTNCTRHGGWTGWSAWSSCSQPCGAAVKTRSRSCTNPSPAHGGKPCGGAALQETLCHANPPCPTETSLPVDGGWGQWSSWGRCSARCGGGFQRRRRSCDSPRPSNGGRACLGCDREWAACNRQPCPEMRQLTPWTPWLKSEEEAGGTQLRFRFQCSAPVGDPELIQVAPVQRDERHCSEDGVCGPASWSGVGWGDWSAWSTCSSPCGGGVQTRSRTCDGEKDSCLGPSRVEQECNTQPCQGEWSCWSSWSPCSVSCGPGSRSRTRQCRPVPGAEAKEAACDGAAAARENCELASCISLAGWSEWSEWGGCDEEGQQQRRRVCSHPEPGPYLCQGSDTQQRPCVATGEGAAARAGGAVGAGRMAAACLVSFCVGGLVTAACTYYILLKRRPGTSIRGSHLYDTLTKPSSNAYVTVRGVHELAELKRGGRTTSSFKSCDFPEKTATIRRSGSSRYTPAAAAELRANLASDAVYS